MQAPFQKVSISKQEAAEHHCPAVSISFEAAARLIITKFPRDGFYVAASGPPGGIEGFSISHRNPGETWELEGPASTITIGGQRVEATPYIAGQSLARRNGVFCVLKAQTDGGTTDVNLDAVVGRQIGGPSIEYVTSHPVIKRMIETLEIS